MNYIPDLTTEQRQKLREAWIAAYTGPREEAVQIAGIFDLGYIADQLGKADEEFDDLRHNLMVLHGNPYKQGPQGVIYAQESVSAARNVQTHDPLSPADWLRLAERKPPAPGWLEGDEECPIEPESPH